MNRFVFVTGNPPANITPPRLQRDNAPPEKLVGALQAAVKNFPKPANMLGVGKIVIEFEDGEGGDAYRRWGEVFTWQHHEAWNETERNINGPAAENTIRLATIRAISRNPTSPLIAVEDVEWGWAIVHASIELVTSGAENTSRLTGRALRKAIVSHCAAKDYTLPLSKLMVRRGISGADIRDLQQAMPLAHAIRRGAGYVGPANGRTRQQAKVERRLISFQNGWNGVGTRLEFWTWRRVIQACHSRLFQLIPTPLERERV